MTGLSVIGVVTGTALMVGAFYWMRSAQIEFLRSYRSRVGGLEAPIDERELEARYRNAPWRLVVDAPGRDWGLLKLLSTRQADPELERMRTRFQRRKGAFYLSIPTGFVIVVLSSILGVR